MEGFLALGFLIGMSHALEADHLAAVGTMATGGSKRHLALRGAVWGLGHTITLFAICSAVIVFGVVLTEHLSAALELGVGVMLVLLGLDVLRRMRRQRVHFHAHDHGDGKPHFHAHSHAGAATPHQRDPHRHAHPHGFPLRALLVGLMHGAAGSAGLIALTVAATQDPWSALAYIALFGLGSMAGMATLSAIAAWPLGWAERGAKLLYRGLTIGAAALAIVLGLDVMAENASLAWGLF
ncbi:MAG: high frequency lysogenization protein HflD [Pseudomonadota bacterium]